MIAITKIRFNGKERIMQQYLIRGNLQDIMRTSQPGEKEKI
jgi:stress-induced morphogen